jgi:demethylmenaquinone methyltransferase/2-methoxy-6-polyprenyl-1,4-benzoquinol methylase
MEIGRVTRTRKDAKTLYNTISRWYDIFAGSSEQKCWDACIQKLDVKEGEQVLEIGFGTGTCLLKLAESVGDSSKVYGVDISEGMCEITQQKINKAGLNKRVNLLCADAIPLPFDTNMFDAVIMNFTLELFDTPEIPRLLSECRRVLRPYGRIGVVSLSKKHGPSMMTTMYELSHRWFPRIVDCRPIFVEDAVVTAGFKIEDATNHSLWGLPVVALVSTKK